MSLSFVLNWLTEKKHSAWERCDRTQIRVLLVLNLGCLVKYHQELKFQTRRTFIAWIGVLHLVRFATSNFRVCPTNALISRQRRPPPWPTLSVPHPVQCRGGGWSAVSPGCSLAPHKPLCQRCSGKTALPSTVFAFFAYNVFYFDEVGPRAFLTTKTLWRQRVVLNNVDESYNILLTNNPPSSYQSRSADRTQTSYRCFGLGRTGLDSVAKTLTRCRRIRPVISWDINTRIESRPRQFWCLQKPKSETRGERWSVMVSYRHGWRGASWTKFSEVHLLAVARKGCWYTVLPSWLKRGRP